MRYSNYSMKLKLTLAFVFLLLALQVVVAAPVQVDAPNNVTAVRGVDKTITLEVTNTNNFTLYDVVVDELPNTFFVSSSKILELLPNETESIALIIKTDAIGDFSRNYEVIGFKKVNCSEFQQRTFDINLRSTDDLNPATPRYEEICINDRVRFKNADSSGSLTLSIPLLSVTQSIGAGNEHIQTFVSNGLYNYRINGITIENQLNANENMNIKVVNSEQNFHDSNLDAVFTLQIKSSLDPTTINSQMDKTVFNISHDDFENVNLKITNTGSKNAESIRIFADDWFIISPPGPITIQPGVSKTQSYQISIKPKIESSSDTNKTHIKTLHITGDNIVEQFINISVFIPYANIQAGNLSSPEYWLARKAHCDAHPTAPDCITEPIIIYRDIPVYDCPPILANLSPSDVKTALDNYFSLQGDINSLGTNLKLDSDTVKAALVELASSYNLTVTDNQKNTEVLESINGTALVVAGLVVFVIIMGVAGFVMYKKYESKKKAAALRY